MAVTINGVVCQELVDDYSEQFDITQGPTARKGYLCPWASRFQVAHGFLGLSSVPALGGLISLQLPLPYPELAAESTNTLASMYARTVEITGAGPPIQGLANIAFTSAKVYVTYGPFPWTFQGIDYFQLDPANPYIWAEQHIDYSGEYITIPGNKVFFKSSGKRLDADWGFFSPIADLTISLKNFPYLPAATVLNALQAPINSVSFLQVNPGYLMFKGLQDTRTKASDGTQTADTTFAFSYRSIAAWDQVYNGATNAWDQVVNASGMPIIARSNLAALIPTSYT